MVTVPIILGPTGATWALTRAKQGTVPDPGDELGRLNTAGMTRTGRICHQLAGAGAIYVRRGPSSAVRKAARGPLEAFPGPCRHPHE